MVASLKRKRIHDDGLCVEVKSKEGAVGLPDEDNFDDAQLPELVHAFPHLDVLHANIERLLAVQANLFFEGFCGTAGVTVGVCVHNVPAVAKPFYLKFGEQYDLLKHEAVVIALIVASILRFLWLGHHAEV